MKLSDLKDEEALEVCAEIIEPMAAIVADEEVAMALRAGVAIKAVKPAISKHKKDVMHILAALEGVPEKEYHCSVLSLPIKLLEFLNDPELQKLFTSQAQKTESSASGSATVTTTAKEK